MKTPCARCSQPGYHCAIGADLKDDHEAKVEAHRQCMSLPESPSRATRVTDARIAMVTARTKYTTHINEGWTPPEAR